MAIALSNLRLLLQRRIPRAHRIHGRGVRSRRVGLHGFRLGVVRLRRVLGEPGDRGRVGPRNRHPGSADCESSQSSSENHRFLRCSVPVLEEWCCLSGRGCGERRGNDCKQVSRAGTDQSERAARLSHRFSSDFIKTSFIRFCVFQGHARIKRNGDRRIQNRELTVMSAQKSQKGTKPDKTMSSRLLTMKVRAVEFIGYLPA